MSRCELFKISFQEFHFRGMNRVDDVTKFCVLDKFSRHFIQKCFSERSQTSQFSCHLSNKQFYTILYSTFTYLIFHSFQINSGTNNAICFHSMKIRILKLGQLSSHFDKFYFQLCNDFLQTIFFFDINKFSTKSMDELLST